jgi:hypothetical protein
MVLNVLGYGTESYRVHHARLPTSSSLPSEVLACLHNGPLEAIASAQEEAGVSAEKIPPGTSAAMSL